MTLRTLQIVTTVSGLMLLGGCGFMFGDDGIFRDRSEDYKKAPEVPVVTVPQGKDTRTLREIYVIPEVEERIVPEGEFEVPRPAPLVAGEGEEIVRIQKLGDDSWALIALAPGQVWPQVRGFLAAAGMQVASVDARAGLIDTTWLSLEGKPLQSRFRFRMEQGVQRGTSELHVLQMNQGRSSDWPPRSDDLAQEAEMLRAVSQYLADSADSSPVSMLADQGLSAGGKISLQETEQGKTFIRLELPFDRAWASLDRSLDKSSFSVTDRDRSAGIFYATFLGLQEEEDAGFFDWLWGDEEHELKDEAFLVTISAVDATTVRIMLDPADAELAFPKRAEQDLLALIKGNIN
ncbi:MAG: outer membrane protein assembly factor BamC [Gammaproteobacteria bacterium]|nr:outer membrane protein assembly factor BamC [Gammaproteobacteria bacterium]